MPEQKRFPTAWNDINNAWNNEDNITAEDTNCADVHMTGVGEPPSNRLELSDFGFSIPANATITNFYMGNRACACNQAGLTYAPLPLFVLEYAADKRCSNQGRKTNYPCSCACADTELEDEFTLVLQLEGKLTPSFFNNEEWVRAYTYLYGPLTIFNHGYFDCVWMRVVYTVPADVTQILSQVI